MSFIDFREVSNPSAGTATTYGSQDLLDIMQIFNGKTVSQKRPRINNAWLWMGGQDIQETTEPAAPPAGIQRLWIDSSDHHVKTKNSSSTIVDITAGGTPGTWNAATAETITNKTINATNNTITDVSTAAGDLLKSNGTKFIRMARGTANQVLAVNSGGTDLVWATAGSGNVNTGNANTYGDFDQIFRSTRLKVTNPANTFNYSFVGSAITAARNITLPLLSVDDTMVTLAATQTLTNKTINATNNTITDTSTASGDLLKSDGTKFTRFGIGTANQVLTVNGAANNLIWSTPAGGGNVSTTSSNTYGDFDQVFRSARVKIANPANTFNYAIVSSAITAAMNITLPLLTLDDVFVCEQFTQNLTNKTINASGNTITDNSIATGDILKSNGTKFVRLPIGTANQVLTVNGTATDIAWAAPTGGGGNVSTGQANTYGDFDQIFRSTRLKVTNPANTFNYSFVGSAITAARNVTLPLLTGDDTLVTLAATQTITGKTIDYNSNTILNLPSGGGNVSTGQINTYGAFDQIFRSGNLKLTNPANTFNYSFVGSAIAAARNITLPLLATNDNMVTEAFAQTLTNKTISGATNTISNIPDAALSTNVNLLNTSQTISAADTFNDQTIKLRNPGNTFSYTLVHGAITADRNLTLPAITANDVIQTVDAVQSPTNKTLNVTNNTVTDTGAAQGDLLKADATGKFLKFPRGSSGQVLTSTGTDLLWATGGGGGGGAGYPANILTVASDGSGDFTTVQAAITAAGVGTIIYVGPGDFSTGSTLSLTGKDRIAIVGCGQGVTRLITTSTSIQGVLGVGNTTGSSLPLTVNTLKKDNTITMSTGNAATLAVGDWILLRSTKVVDNEFTPNFLAGEIHQIRAIASGVLTLDDRVVEDYNTADSANAIKLSLIEDITFQDLTFMTNSTGGANTLHNGWIDFRFGRNIRFLNVEITNVGWGAIMLESCVAPLISNCNIHDINYDPAVQPLNYGIVLHSATRDAIISNCIFRRTRHAMTAGGDSGTDFEGYVLNTLVSNCISLETNTAHYDSHQACKFITYVNCKGSGGQVIAGSGATTIHGFQTRSPFTKFLECTTIDIPGRGLYAYGDISSAAAVNKSDDLVVENCDFIYTKFNTASALGQGIFIENFIQRPRIVGCRITNSDGIAITLNQENDNAVIQNNTIFNATTTTFRAIDTFSCDDAICTGNRISGHSLPISIVTQSGRPASTNWIISCNDFTGCTTTQGSYTGTAIQRTLAVGALNIPAQT